MGAFRGQRHNALNRVLKAGLQSALRGEGSDKVRLSKEVL